MEYLEIIYRALISLVILFLVTKMIGKKQVSQLSLFDYVIGISIGNFAAELTINLEAKASYGLLAIVVFGLIAFLISVLTMKSIVLRRFFMGTPTMIIQNGKIIEKNLKKVKFDINDLLEECRTGGYFDISNIEYALMEGNGKLSFIPKSSNKYLTPQDMNLVIPQEELVANVIIDGHIMQNNLKNINKDEKWIKKQIKIKGYKLDDILLATIDSNEKINIYEKNVQNKIKNVLE